MESLRKKPLLLIAALAATAALPLEGADAQIVFADVTATSGVAHTGESYGASWGDLNGDGFPDLFANNHRERPSLFLNRGNGTFVDTAPQVLTWQNHPNSDTHGGTWADFDNDGDQDLMVSTGTTNPDQLFVNENGRLVDRAAERGVEMVAEGGRMPIWFDYDGDHLLDFVMMQYAGIAKVFKQNPGGTFTETTVESTLLCKQSHYGQLFDLSGDGRLDLLCSDEAVFPQKVYDTSTLPWTKVYDSTAPSPFLPALAHVADSIIGDFNNDGFMDMFVLSGVQLRPSTVDRSGGSSFEANLTGGNKGFKFVSPGVVTFNTYWNGLDNQPDLSRVRIGAGGRIPAANPIVLDPADPSVQGMPPPVAADTPLPQMQIGYDPATQQWTLVIVTKPTPESPSAFSEAYLQVSSTGHISALTGTGRWPTDKPGRPTLLTYTAAGFVDTTDAAGLGALVQCGSVTTGDFDNDMDLDLYLACRTGASNVANILYENLGNGTFVAVPDAGGAAGPVGEAMAGGAGTADTVVTADYDLDGFLDLFVTNGYNLRPLRFGGENKLFHNAGNANHWLELDLVGVNSDRDATGARVYATANGVTQVRVQNGAYHRWAQDMKRAHFGLGAATTVDLRVDWPSGLVENFTGITANMLYRITEGSGIAPVALGAAPAYSCGSPLLNGAVDSGIFLWRDCPSGEWRMKTVTAGGAATYSGTISSSSGFTAVEGMGLDSTDALDASTNPYLIAFSFNSSGTGSDGVNFTPPDGAVTCLSVSAPAGSQVFYGPFRAPLTPPFNLETQAPCQ